MAIETYKGNPNLKSAQVRQEYTQEQVTEFIKCSQDPVYFIESYVNIVSIDFLEKKGRQTRFISFDAKTARGLMARWMSLEKPRSISDVKDFNLNGYAFDQSASTDLSLVFTRKKPASRKAS